MFSCFIAEEGEAQKVQEILPQRKGQDYRLSTKSARLSCPLSLSFHKHPLNPFEVPAAVPNTEIRWGQQTKLSVLKEPAISQLPHQA